MAIREVIANFIERASDIVVYGRNASRIVLGTDRKDTVDSGYGDGSETAEENSSVIDLVAGYIKKNPDYLNDKSRIYIAAKTDPDDYFQMELGEGEIAKGAIVLVSDNVYLKARNNIKIRNGNATILIQSDGNIQIETPENTNIKSGESVLTMQSNGDITMGSENGQSARIITENDTCTGPDSTTGAAIVSRFVNTLPGATVNNNKVKINI